MSFGSFITCSNYPTEKKFYNYIQSKYYILTIFLIGIVTMLTLRSLLSRRSGSRTISEKDEEKIVERLLDRLKNQQESSSKKTSGTNEKKICQLFRQDQGPRPTKEVKNKENTTNVMEPVNNRTRTIKDSKRNGKEEIKCPRENKKQQEEYCESNEKKLLEPNDNAISPCETIENHIKVLEDKIQELLNDICAKGEKSPQKGSEYLIKNLKSMEETLRGLRDVCCKSTVSDNSSMSEELIRIEDFLNKISENIDVVSEGKIKYQEEDDQFNLEKAESNPPISRNEKLRTQSDKNSNKVDVIDTDHEQFSQNAEENFKKDLNNLLQKYFGDTLGYKLGGNDKNKNADDEKPPERDSKETKCRENLEKITQLTIDLEKCNRENQKIVEHNKNQEIVIATSDNNLQVNDTLDPNVMIEFKKDLKIFLRKYFGDESNNFEGKRDERNYSKKRDETVDNEAVFLENEIIEVIKKELSQEKHKVRGKEAESLSQTTLSNERNTSKVSSKSQNQNGSKGGQREHQKTSERMNESNDSFKFEKENGGEQEKKQPLLIHDLQLMLEKILADHLREKSVYGRQEDDEHEYSKGNFQLGEEILEASIKPKETHDSTSQIIKDLKAQVSEQLNGEHKEKSELQTMFVERVKVTDDTPQRQSELKNLSNDDKALSKRIKIQEHIKIDSEMKDLLNQKVEQFQNIPRKIEVIQKSEHEINLNMNNNDVDSESKDEIKAVLLRDLMKRIENETTKFKNELRLEILEKVVDYLTSENDNIEYNTKEYLTNKIEKIIDEKYKISKEQLKLEFTEEIEKQFSDNTEESLNQIKSVISEEIDRQIDMAVLDLEPGKHKKSFKNFFKKIGKHLPHLPKTKSKKNMSSHLDYDNGSEIAEFEEGMREDILNNIGTEIDNEPKLQKKFLGDPETTMENKDTMTQLFYQLGITENFQTFTTDKNCDDVKTIDILERTKRIRNDRRTNFTPIIVQNQKSHYPKSKVNSNFAGQSEKRIREQRIKRPKSKKTAEEKANTKNNRFRSKNKSQNISRSPKKEKQEIINRNSKDRSKHNMLNKNNDKILDRILKMMREENEELSD